MVEGSGIFMQNLGHQILRIDLSRRYLQSNQWFPNDVHSHFTVKINKLLVPNPPGSQPTTDAITADQPPVSCQPNLGSNMPPSHDTCHFTATEYIDIQSPLTQRNSGIMKVCTRSKLQETVRPLVSNRAVQTVALDQLLRSYQAPQKTRLWVQNPKVHPD